MLATVGDKSGYSIECVINCTEKSFDRKNFRIGREFVYFGGTVLTYKGIFIYFLIFFILGEMVYLLLRSISVINLKDDIQIKHLSFKSLKTDSFLVKKNATSSYETPKKFKEEDTKNNDLSMNFSFS